MKNFFKPHTFGDEYSDGEDDILLGEVLEVEDEDLNRVVVNVQNDGEENDGDPEYDDTADWSGSEDSSGVDNDNEDDDDDDDDELEIHCIYPPHSGRFANNSNNAIAGTSEEMDEGLDEEDAVIQKIIAETKKTRDHPPDISTEDFVFDLCFHPSENLLAVGTITGDVNLYQYTNDENTMVRTLEVHTKAVRKINFSEDGATLFSVSKDKSIMLSDVETGKLKNFFDKSHENPIYTMAIINENVFATGDDDGILKIWDLRQKQNKASFELKLVEDYISQILTNDDQKILVAVSGDGYLTSVNIRAKKLLIQSEPYEEELNCMGLFRNDSKLVVGSSKGKLYSYNWGEFGLHSDMFYGPKTGINCMVPITNRIAVIAGEEGILRAMHVVPGRNLGVVGQHALGVESIDICNTGEFIASSSHDHDIKFWNIKYFEDFDDIKYNAKSDERKAMRHNLPSSKNVNVSDFFSDLVND